MATKYSLVVVLLLCLFLSKASKCTGMYLLLLLTIILSEHKNKIMIQLSLRSEYILALMLRWGAASMYICNISDSDVSF